MLVKNKNLISDKAKIRSSFPFFFHEKTKDISYLDNASSTQKPNSVIERIRQCYEHEYANVHRGVYALSEDLSTAYEDVRKRTAAFLGQGVSEDEIIFTSGTTHGHNLIAYSWVDKFLKPGDEILLPVSEHHSNIVPWEIIAKKKGLNLVFIPLDSHFRLDLHVCERLMSKRTRFLAFQHVSNVLGTINPAKELIQLAKQKGIVTLIDGAQASPHFSFDVKDLGCDFYTFSAHKVCGPTGVGILYGKREILESMPPFFGGGNMIESVSTSGSSWKQPPHRFEAGTPHIAGVIGLGASLDFIDSLDRKALLELDIKLGERLLSHLEKNKKIRTFVKERNQWVGIVSFYHEDIHGHDLAAILSSQGVCVRAGNHCAQPLLHFLQAPTLTRVSPYIYNTEDEIDKLVLGLEKAETMFS
ncbi:MAG: cysteine desulfurase [Oligoflexales bacterium]|nr:cysteine desulfurase [Oligoflexales bacterium]